MHREVSRCWLPAKEWGFPSKWNSLLSWNDSWIRSLNPVTLVLECEVSEQIFAGGTEGQKAQPSCLSSLPLFPLCFASIATNQTAGWRAHYFCAYWWTGWSSSPGMSSPCSWPDRNPRDISRTCMACFPAAWKHWEKLLWFKPQLWRKTVQPQMERHWLVWMRLCHWMLCCLRFWFKLFPTKNPMHLVKFLLSLNLANPVRWFGTQFCVKLQTVELFCCKRVASTDVPDVSAKRSKRNF